MKLTVAEGRPAGPPLRTHAVGVFEHSVMAGMSRLVVLELIEQPFSDCREREASGPGRAVAFSRHHPLSFPYLLRTPCVVAKQKLQARERTWVWSNPARPRTGCRSPFCPDPGPAALVLLEKPATTLCSPSWEVPSSGCLSSPMIRRSRVDLPAHWVPQSDDDAPRSTSRPAPRNRIDSP